MIGASSVERNLRSAPDLEELPDRTPRLRRAFRSRRLVVGAAVIALIVLMALLAPVVAPYSPFQQVPEFNMRPPGWREPSGAIHLLGTDILGRDVLSRIIFGARVSLLIGAVAVLIAGSIGVCLGLVAGYFGGLVETVVMRLVDTILAIPFFLLAIVSAALFGQSLLGVIVILGLTSWLGYARIVRGVVLTLKTVPYVEAAHALGAGHARTLVRHILPGVWAPVIVVATQQVGAMIIAESSLTFLGLGVPPDIPTWGAMIADGRGYVSLAWWISTLPGLALMLTVLAVYFFGDGLRDVLDPRLRV
jgi:ABC-type dipeptide/oligopeptide/nickel transport system permease subunit